MSDRARDGAVAGHIGLPASPYTPPPEPKWDTSQATPCCRYGHPIVWVKETRGHGLHMNVGGHLLQFCQRCEPATFAFGVANRDTGTTTWYDITREQYEQLKAINCDADTLEIIRFLGYRQYGADSR